MVEHASGYTYKSHEEIGTVGKIKKYESDADKTTFYYDDLLEERELKFCMQYVEAVANPRPVFVSVQDYYNPSAKADTKVELTSRQGEDACDVCGCACSECFDRIPSCTALDEDNDGGETNENSISSEFHYRRVYPKGPKPEILIEPEMPPIPDSSTLPWPELETATLAPRPPRSHLQAVQNDLKQIEDFPTANLADFVVPKTEISLTELDEAAKNMQMPEK